MCQCVLSEGAFNLAFRSFPPYPVALEIPFLPSRAQGQHKVRGFWKGKPRSEVVISVVAGEPDFQLQVSLRDPWQSAAGGLPGGGARGWQRAARIPQP